MAASLVTKFMDYIEDLDDFGDIFGVSDNDTKAIDAAKRITDAFENEGDFKEGSKYVQNADKYFKPLYDACMACPNEDPINIWKAIRNANDSQLNQLNSILAQNAGPEAIGKWISIGNKPPLKDDRKNPIDDTLTGSDPNKEALRRLAHNETEETADTVKTATTQTPAKVNNVLELTGLDELQTDPVNNEANIKTIQDDDEVKFPKTDEEKAASKAAVQAERQAKKEQAEKEKQEREAAKAAKQAEKEAEKERKAAEAAALKAQKAADKATKKQATAQNIANQSKQQTVTEPAEPVATSKPQTQSDTIDQTRFDQIAAALDNELNIDDMSIPDETQSTEEPSSNADATSVADEIPQEPVAAELSTSTIDTNTKPSAEEPGDTVEKPSEPEPATAPSTVQTAAAPTPAPIPAAAEPQTKDETPDTPETGDPRKDFEELYDNIDKLAISSAQAEEAKRYADIVFGNPGKYPREYAILSGNASNKRTRCIEAMLSTANKKLGYKAPVSRKNTDKLDFQSGIVSQSKGRTRVGPALVMPSGFGLKKNAAIWNTPVITDFGYPFLNFSSEAMLSVIKSKKDDEALKNHNLKKMFKDAAKRYGGIWKAIYSSPLTLLRQIATDVGIRCTPKYLKIDGSDLIDSDSGENVTVIPIKYYSVDAEFDGFISVPRDFLTAFYDVVDYSSTSKRMYMKYAQGMSEEEFAQEITNNRGIPPFYLLVPKQAKCSKCHIRSGSLLGSLMNVILGRKKCTMVKTVFQGKRGCIAMETDTANILYADI